ncbi:MAG: hypothetical protein ABMA64_24005 [Myxococcota bacterium]
MFTVLLAASAFAAPENAGNASVVLGFGAVPGTGDPSSLRLGLRFEVPVASDDLFGFGVVFPIEAGTSGTDGFGFDTRSTALELAPSIRGRLLPAGQVRLYADLGFGVVYRFSSIDTWFGSATDNRTAFMLRSALGVEIGGTQPDSVALVLEPIGYRHYGVDENGADVYAAMAGVQFPF